MRLHLFSCLSVSALTLGLLPACEGGQTGDLSGEHPNGGLETGAGGCDEHKQKLAGFDEMTDAGSAEQLLAYAEQSFEAPITWKVAGDGQAWAVGPESGAGKLHVDVTRGASAYLLTYTQKPSNNGLELANGAICPGPRLGVEAHVNVTTDGGALAESYDTLLRSSTAGVATLSVPLDLQKLGGSLTVSDSDPHAKVVQVSLAAMLSAEGTTGSISGMEEAGSGSGPESSVSARAALLAVWPGSAACAAFSTAGDGLTAPVTKEMLGATGEASIASVAFPNPSAITWMDGTKTTVTVDIAATGDGCFRLRDDLPIGLEPSGPGVTYPVTIALKSDDGRVDGTYAGQVAVTGTGSQRRVIASASLQLALADVAKSGFASVNVPSGSNGILVSIDSKLIDGVASGSVNLFALASPPCPTEPQKPMNTPESGGSASSPGCAGQSETRLENAYWTD